MRTFLTVQAAFDYALSEGQSDATLYVEALGQDQLRDLRRSTTLLTAAVWALEQGLAVRGDFEIDGRSGDLAA